MIATRMGPIRKLVRVGYSILFSPEFRKNARVAPITRGFGGTPRQNFTPITFGAGQTPYPITPHPDRNQGRALLGSNKADDSFFGLRAVRHRRNGPDQAVSV